MVPVVLASRWQAADALDRLGRSDTAATVLELLVDSTSVGVYDGEVWYRGFVASFAHWRLARLYVLLGDRAKAQRHWDLFEEAFTNPDPELRWMIQRSPLDGYTELLEPLCG